ncbi:MAG: family 43 glycosylhydrolase [Bacteroidales bacterium]|nr:family 43 glycosylhydrolase [Bacteroidales bacterium]
MKHILSSIIFSLLCCFFCNAQETNSVSNTIYKATYSKKKQTIQVYKSSTLKKHFTIINDAITDKNELDLSKGENHLVACYNEFDSSLYVIGANTNTGQKFIVHAKNPSEKWSKPVFLTNSRIGTDPSLFWDKDGACYLQCTSDNNIIQIVIDPITGEELSSFHYLTTGLDGHQIKNPCISLIGNNYFLIFLEDKKITTLKSDDIWGPFTVIPNNTCIYFQF